MVDSADGCGIGAPVPSGNRILEYLDKIRDTGMPREVKADTIRGAQGEPNSGIVDKIRDTDIPRQVKADTIQGVDVHHIEIQYDNSDVESVWSIIEDGTHE